MKNLHYKIIGIISLIVGIIGAFLPLLPTTCFVLLSAWCFAKSSPEWHARLLNNKLFGQTIRDWETHRCISAKGKIMAISSMLIFGTASFIFIESNILRISLIALLCIGIYSVHHFSKQRFKKQSVRIEH